MRTISTRAVISAAALTAVVSLAGCGNHSNDTNADPKPTATSSVSAGTVASSDASPTSAPTVTPSYDAKSGQAIYCDPKTQNFTGAAADTFGADKVAQAYCETVNFLLNNSYTGLMKEQHPKASEFNFVEPYLSSAGQAKWKSDVKAYLNGDDNAGKYVATLTESKNALGGLKFPEHVQVSDLSFSPATTTVVNKTTLNMVLTIKANVAVVQDPSSKYADSYTPGKTYQMPYTKVVSINLVPRTVRAGEEDSTKAHWLIDNWEGNITYGSVPPDKK